MDGAVVYQPAMYFWNQPRLEITTNRASEAATGNGKRSRSAMRLAWGGEYGFNVIGPNA